MIVAFCGNGSVEGEIIGKLKLKLTRVTEYLIGEGHKVFISDGYSEYSNLCREVIEELKGKYPLITWVPVAESAIPDFDGNVDSSYINGLWGECDGYNNARKIREYLISKADCIVSVERYDSELLSDAVNLKFTKDKDLVRIKI